MVYLPLSSLHSFEPLSVLPSQSKLATPLYKISRQQLTLDIGSGIYLCFKSLVSSSFQKNLRSVFVQVPHLN